MARPTTFDLELYASDTFGLQITFVDGNGDAIDKSDYEFSAQIRKNRWDDVALVDLDVDTSSAASGTIIVGLAASQVTTELHNGYWDLQQADSAATPNIRTLLQGAVYCDQDVTR